MTHLSFQRRSPRGDVLRGDVRLPEGPPPRSAIIVAHGFKGFKDWGFFPWLCEHLAAGGHAVVSFNFSHNGIGEDPVEFTELERFGANTLSRELDELRFVLGEVLNGDLLPRRPDRVGLLGHSRGGGQAVLASSEEPRVGALVTWAAVSHFDRWTEETKAQWRAEGRVWVLNSRTGVQMPVDVSLLRDFEEHRERLDVTAAASRVRVPWLIVHGSEDLTVWPGEATNLARVNPSTRVVMVEGAGHTFEVGHPFLGPSPELLVAATATADHLRKHLVEPTES